MEIPIDMFKLSIMGDDDTEDRGVYFNVSHPSCPYGMTPISEFLDLEGVPNCTCMTSLMSLKLGKQARTSETWVQVHQLRYLGAIWYPF